MRVGLAGAGFIGREHIRSAQSVPDLDFVGYVDPQARRDHPDLLGLRAFASLDSLLREPLDGVILAVPDEFHLPMAAQCLAAGCAVLLEKPAARSLAECLELSRSSPDIGRRLLVGHTRRYHPATRLTKDLIDQGRLGRLIGVKAIFALRKDEKYFRERPRGVGLVNLIHDLDLLQHFCGRLRSVAAYVSHAARSAAEEDTIAMALEFASGAVGTLIGTDSAPSPWGWDQGTRELPSIPFLDAGTTYSILGTKASLSVPDLRFYEHREGEAWHHPLVETKLEIPEENAFVNQLRHFADVMRGTSAPQAGIHDALVTQAALEAAFVSAREGRRVVVDELVHRATQTQLTK